MVQAKSTNYIPFILLAFAVSITFWIVANSTDVYRYAVIGAVFEILWLPMIAVTFAAPILALVLWIIRLRKKATV